MLFRRADERRGLVLSRGNSPKFVFEAMVLQAGQVSRRPIASLRCHKRVNPIEPKTVDLSSYLYPLVARRRAMSRMPSRMLGLCRGAEGGGWYAPRLQLAHSRFFGTNM